MKDFNELLKVGKAAFDTMYQGVGTLAVWFSVAILLVLAAGVALTTMKNRANFAVAMRFSLGVVVGVIVVIAAFAVFLPLAKSNAYKEIKHECEVIKNAAYPKRAGAPDDTSCRRTCQREKSKRRKA